MKAMQPFSSFFKSRESRSDLVGLRSRLATLERENFELSKKLEERHRELLEAFQRQEILEMKVAEYEDLQTFLEAADRKIQALKSALSDKEATLAETEALNAILSRS